MTSSDLLIIEVLKLFDCLIDWSEILGLIDLISKFEILKALKPLISFEIPKGLENLKSHIAWKIDLKIGNIYIFNVS